MIKILSKFLTVLSLTFFAFNTSLANTGELELNSAYNNSETISELKGNLEVLNSEKEGLKDKLNLLKEEIELKDFFIENLSSGEIEEIKNIIASYRKININLNSQLTIRSKNLDDVSGIRKEIIAERIQFYKDLIVFIDKSKLEEYKEYIKSDTQILKDKKEVNAEINKNEEILKNRVNVIKEKIQEHKTFLDEKLKAIIETKLNEKIENLKNNSKFKILNLELKKSVLEKTIQKIEEKIEILKNTDNLTNIISKKIEIYEIALDKINDLLNSYSISNN